jgi:2-iminobutanoate/2-iminopropanoate deaminase
MKKIISTKNAPSAIGPYSQAVEAKGTLYISGQIAINPSTGKLVEGRIREQTMQVLTNMGNILREAGYDYKDVVKTTCLLSDIADFKEMNEAYSTFYADHKPARATFAVKGLPMNALIEIDAIAVK